MLFLPFSRDGPLYFYAQIPIDQMPVVYMVRDTEKGCSYERREKSLGDVGKLGRRRIENSERYTGQYQDPEQLSVVG